jgi:hypothetical protein
MSDLIVKDNALMNASYNLALVEQRLILLAIIEARESGKGINANEKTCGKLKKNHEKANTQ